MTTLDLVDPEQRGIVASFPPFDPERDDLGAFRTELAAGMAALLPPAPVGADVVAIPGAPGGPGVRALIHRPAGAAGAVPAILSLHGGGLIAGTPDMMAGAHARLAREAGAVIVAPDYRLAPETPFPGGLEDAHAALVWIAANAGALGVDPARISVMGDSAGGGLAAALALLARDRGSVPLRAQILLYPMLDLRTGGPDAPSDDPLTGAFVWTRAQNRFAWAAAAGGAPPPQPGLGYLSPALAEDLTGLPPAYVMTGALDLFRDEDAAYALRLMRAGVAVELAVHAGAVHGFDNLPGAIAERARAACLAAIRRMI